MPEIRCNMDAMAMGGNFKVPKSRLTGLFVFTIDFFLVRNFKYSTVFHYHLE